MMTDFLIGNRLEIRITCFCSGVLRFSFDKNRI